MTDIKTPEERSRNMAAIKRVNTKPEIYVRKTLFSNGFRYRIQSKTIPGHPDLWLKKYNTAIFVNGCFWHRHKGCKYAYIPKSRVEFWQKKFEANINRDITVRNELNGSGIKCLIIWECTIHKMMKDKSFESEKLELIKQFLLSHELWVEI